jgi:N-acetyl-anhydromuramyl-L-alanine amidase AmpD
MLRHLKINIARWATSTLAICTIVTAASMPAAAQSSAASQADCPPGVECQVVPAGLVDGGCNWSRAHRPSDLPVYGINDHTTEGSLEAVLAEAQDTNNCVSWNYLVDQTGKVYVAVPPDSLAYDVGNWWANTHYVQIEHVGRAEDCSTITPAEYRASVRLHRYLIQRFHIDANSATITGHDSIPGVKDSAMPVRHWDPGVCWPWARFLSNIGAPIVPTASPKSPVVTIHTRDSEQPVADCPGPGFTQCTDPAQTTTNFVALYTAPSTAAPLLSDPYLHSDNSAGSIAMQDWGDKAPVGHAYVVLGHQPGWTQIQYSGTTAWFQDNGRVTVPTKAAIVTPKGNTPVAIYGRPMPEFDAPGWASIPYDHQTQVALTKYSMLPGQQYSVAPVPDPRTDYAEGCNLADCSGPGDGTVVIGQTKYIEISWSHHFAFVKADDIQYVSQP